jgi:DNA invertase Pin-like site-specific DNA recombinase
MSFMKAGARGLGSDETSHCCRGNPRGKCGKWRGTDKGAGFRSLGDTWADTTTAQGHLMLTVLGGLAEFERELIRTCTSEGRERAKAKGVKLGRKPKLTEHQKREAIKRREQREETLVEIDRSYNVSG